MLKTIGMLALFTAGKSINTVCVKLAQRGAKSNLFQHILFVQLFSVLQALLLFTLPPYKALEFSPERLLLPFLFGTFYIVYMVLTVMALEAGPASLTYIIGSFCSVVPIFAGLLFWGDTLSLWQGIGLVLFCLSLYLFNSGSYSDSAVKKPITPRWVFLALAALAFAGMAVTCTRRYCDLYPGYVKEYLFIAFMSSAAWAIPFTGYALVKKGLLGVSSRMLGYTALAALLVDVSNIIFMIYASAFSAAFYYPLTSVLGVVGVALGSYIFLRERVSRRALIGIVVAAAALALLAMS